MHARNCWTDFDEVGMVDVWDSPHIGGVGATCVFWAHTLTCHVSEIFLFSFVVIDMFCADWIMYRWWATCPMFSSSSSSNPVMMRMLRILMIHNTRNWHPALVTQSALTSWTTTQPSTPSSYILHVLDCPESYYQTFQTVLLSKLIFSWPPVFVKGILPLMVLVIISMSRQPTTWLHRISDNNLSHCQALTHFQDQSITWTSSATDAKVSCCCCCCCCWWWWWWCDGNYDADDNNN